MVSGTRLLTAISMMIQLNSSYFKRLCYSLICFAVVIVSSPTFGAKSKAMLAWSEQDFDGVYNMYFSRQTDDGWSDPLLISATGYPEVLPAIGSNEQGDVWLAWTELQEGTGHIMWCRFSEGRWSDPAVLETQTTSDMAPSIAVDKHGVAWLVYSGSEKKDDDIFVTRWTDSGWTVPVRLNQDDDWPDILPVISIDATGYPIVSWQGFNGRNYVQYQSRRIGSNWSQEKPLEPLAKQVPTGKTPTELQIEKSMNELPGFLKDTSQAVFHSTIGQRETIKLRTR